MKLLAFLLAAAGSCLATIGNFRVLGTTATQALIAYSAPDGGACTIQVSPNPGLTPPALDVDPGTFLNSSLDLSRASTVASGRSRMVLIGQRTAQYATAGAYAGVRHFSRALQAYTPYFGQITCPSTGDTLPFTFTTGNIPLGSTYSDPWLSDRAHPGDQPWPESVGGLAPESFIDPLTGVLLQRLGLRGNNYGYWGNIPFGSAYNQGQNPCDTAGPWTSPCNVTAGSGSTTIGNSTAPLVLRPLLTGNNAWDAGYGSSNYGQPWTLDQLSVSLTGSVNSATSAFRVLDACLSMNGGASCAGSVQQLTMGQTSSQQTLNPVSTSQFGVAAWLLDTNPRLNVQESSPHSGTATVAGNTVTWLSGDNFSLYWVTGGNGRIRLSANNDACITPPSSTTSSEYAIAAIVDGTHLTVSGTPPAGTVYWCANSFAIMLWRDRQPTDGSVVTLTAANMAALESTAPTYPDNGAGTACFNKLVNGGFFCLFGGLYWINPATGSSAYYGYMIGAAADQHGNSIANPWKTIGIIPAGEAANIDQSQNQLTFYTVALDPAGGGPLVIQGVFNPASISQPATPYGNGSQIQNASVTGSTAYSVTYGNGLTFTNLTPQVSAAESVANQMTWFDPTFDVTKFSTGPNGWNCIPYGMSAGVFYFTCYSIGEDSPAWAIAFSPGDGNPAHAGHAGGPQIVGALNTFNTPNSPVAATQTALTGRSLHALTETGETGWIQVQANPYPPINTSNASLPASSPDCSTYGLASGRQCILLNLNSHTAGGMTGYEPYFSPAQFQFTGAPGELRTTQIGDTACVAASTLSNCDWPDRQQELLILEIKNYGGVSGAWVFQRNGYGAEVAIASGPVTLWWQSAQWAIPPGGTTANSSMAAYWNPLAGCGGAPDPHGNCLIQDINNTSGHGEWRDGGEAVATNVPAWSMPIWGWPTDYQTAVGSAPGIFSLPFANVTPYQVAGVNYTSTNPPFAGVYGHPWGFDAGCHPNAAGSTASTYEALRAFDNTPVQGGEYEPTFSPVTGQLYAATPSLVTDADDFFGSGSTVAINRKLMAQGDSCGSHPLIDISGPGSSIATGASGSYSVCFARANGECYPGSATGQVYVNCPGVVWNYCSGSGIHGGTPLGVGNDICVGNISNTANAVRQFTLDQTDFAGSFTRTLLTATSRLRMVFGFENNRLLPDNSWLLLRTDFLNYQRSDMWMAKMLPYPAPDSVARGTFVPITLTLKPPAGLPVNNAIVQFGYQEYGAPSLLNCTTRNDACIANAGTVPSGNAPFYFASENPSGELCASGCAITIPAISQRVLFYRVQYRNASQAVLATGPLSAIVVP
ncbi:MAG TPA: hypothetical protein VMI94_22470 [Bryobacteraceae bacterium]|nr:hypothetical protein [Bryobacteraceae bacterium]